MSGNDEFDRITEGMSAPDPDLEGAALAGRQIGAVYASIKAFGVPDAQAEYLTKAYLELGTTQADGP